MEEESSRIESSVSDCLTITTERLHSRDRQEIGLWCIEHIPIGDDDMTQHRECVTDGIDSFRSLMQDHFTRADMMDHAMEIIGLCDRHRLVDRIDERSSTELIGNMSLFVARRTDSENIMRSLTVMMSGFVDIGSGSDDGRDASLDDLSGLGFAHLVSDSYFVSCFDEFGDILVGTVIGHACHRDGMVRSLVLRCEDEIEELATELSIFPEYFIEISQTKKKNTIRILFLQIDVLLHSGSEGGHWKV